MLLILDLFYLDIADVTNFVHPGTPLDDEASKRGTSVYLVDRRIDMLPKPLTEGIIFLQDMFPYMLEFQCTQETWFCLQIFARLELMWKDLHSRLFGYALSFGAQKLMYKY